MSAYISDLPAPRGAQVNATMSARGREVFRGNCTACHNVDQSEPVPPLIVSLKQLWLGYRPIVLMPRVKTFGPVQNSPGIYDDKLIIADASKRGDPKGIPMRQVLGSFDDAHRVRHDGRIGRLVLRVGEAGLRLKPSSGHVRGRAPVEHALAPPAVRLVVPEQQVLMVAMAPGGDRQHLLSGPPVEALHQAVRLWAVGSGVPVLSAEPEAARRR